MLLVFSAKLCALANPYVGVAFFQKNGPWNDERKEVVSGART